MNGSPHSTTENFIVAARVRAYVSQQGLKLSDESVDALNREVHRILDRALDRTRSNKRLTLRPHDL